MQPSLVKWVETTKLSKYSNCTVNLLMQQPCNYLNCISKLATISLYIRYILVYPSHMMYLALINNDSFRNVLTYAHIVQDIITARCHYYNTRDPMPNLGQIWIFYKAGQTQLTQAKCDLVDLDDLDDLTWLQRWSEGLLYMLAINLPLITNHKIFS